MSLTQSDIIQKVREFNQQKMPVLNDSNREDVKQIFNILSEIESSSTNQLTDILIEDISIGTVDGVVVTDDSYQLLRVSFRDKKTNLPFQTMVKSNGERLISLAGYALTAEIKIFLNIINRPKMDE